MITLRVEARIFTLTQRPTHDLSFFIPALTSSSSFSPLLTPAVPASLLCLRYAKHVPTSGSLHLLLLLPRMLFAHISTCLWPYSGFFLNVPSPEDPSLMAPCLEWLHSSTLTISIYTLILSMKLIFVLINLYQFCIAAVRKYHKFTGSTQPRFNLL